jgi:hypothetical protein
MPKGNNTTQESPKKPQERAEHQCSHRGMYMSGFYDEYRKIPSATRHDEYEMEWVTVQVWECPDCGMVEYEDYD